MDLLSENGKPHQLSRDVYEELDAFYQAHFKQPRTLQEMANAQLSGRYNSVKTQIKTLVNYNRKFHAAPASETFGETKRSGEVPAPPSEIPASSSTVQPNAKGSGISLVFTGPWKHLYEFLWHQGFDLSQSQDDYKAAFETYRSEFGKKTTGSGKQKKAAYEMPSSSDAKSVRQGYHRQLERHLARQ